MSEPALDAHVTGSGLDGMVSAAELAKAGCSSALVDARDRLARFTSSAEQLVRGCVHGLRSCDRAQSLTGKVCTWSRAALHQIGLRHPDGAVTAGVADDKDLAAGYRDSWAPAAKGTGEAYF